MEKGALGHYGPAELRGAHAGRREGSEGSAASQKPREKSKCTRRSGAWLYSSFGSGNKSIRNKDLDLYR